MAYSSSNSFQFFLLSLIFTTLCLFHLASCDYDDPTVEMYEEWTTKFCKVPKNETEKEYRFKIFSDNVKHINQFNKADNKSYTLAINQFTDLTNAEFVALVGTAKLPEGIKCFEHLTHKVPDCVDWRPAGAVTPVKNQNPCGSCWAFAAVAAVEGIVQIKTGRLISLSEQELLDCAFNLGCGVDEGGWVERAFDFIISNGGIDYEFDYGYTAVRKTCDSSKLTNKAASISSYTYVTQNNEHQLMLAVAKQPVAVYIDASGIQSVGTGIFDGPCGTTRNHVVTIVGYGQINNGKKFWIAKNSWGTTFGDNGYIYFAKDVAAPQGVCGLAMDPIYPNY